MAINNNIEIDLQIGKFLVAEPFMLDPNFKRVVILLCDHQEKEGTIGFVLNKSVDMNITDLVSNFPEFESEVFFGGPVQTDTIHYVHRVGHLLDDSVKVAEGLWWGGNFEQLKSLVNTKVIQPEDIRFFVGYSGWGEGQLLEEMKAKTWFLAENDVNFVFNEKYFDSLWKEVLEKAGGSFSIIGQIPDKVCLS
jgi:putative transcriptional regulator